MIDWIQAWFCMHKFVTDHEIKRYVLNKDGTDDTRGYTYILRCEKCGRVVKSDIVI